MMKRLAMVICVVAILQAAVTAFASPTCGAACNNEACDIPQNCTGILCGCKLPPTCTKLPVGCEDPPSPPPKPLPIAIGSLELAGRFDGAGFKGSSNSIEDAIERLSGWTINVDSDVAQFEVTGEWTATDWYAILSDMLEDAGACWSTNGHAHVITVSNC